VKLINSNTKKGLITLTKKKKWYSTYFIDKR